MDLYQLKYFSAVAKTQNIHQAAALLHVSPAALSKAIRLLEVEFSVSLFERVGRNIRITAEGKHLQLRAAELLTMADSVTWEMKGDQTDLSVAFSGREFLLSHFGVQYAKQINTFFPKSSFIYQECSGQDALKAVEEGSTDFYITIQRPESTCLFSKVIGAFKLVPSVGSHHPLYKRAKKGETLTVADLLKYEFVSPNAPLFVISGARQSVDGWRDDKFPRNVRWQTDRASILTSIAQSEQAIAFVPEYFALQHQLFPLSIKDLLPSTKQSVYVAIRKMDRKNWRQDALCIE